VSAAAQLDRHIAQWRLTRDAEPFETHSSWLCFVRQGERRALLKIFKPGSDEVPSARYFAAHKGSGTVRVLQSDGDAILIERISPGTRLTELSAQGRDDEASHIICDTIEKLQQSHADIAGWPGHDEHLAQFTRCRAAPPVTTEIAARAADSFRALNASQDQHVLLHGDLHHENILFDQERGWLAIDPKGEIGELAYEIAAPLRNPLESPDLFMLPAEMDRRVHIYCERLQLDRERVLGWCFARNASAALWHAGRTPEPLRDKAWSAATLTALELLQDHGRRAAEPR
jgi:streptomycin 6-kinase